MFPATISFLISMDSAPAEIRGRECRQILETARSYLEDNNQDNMNSICGKDIVLDSIAGLYMKSDLLEMTPSAFTT